MTDPRISDQSLIGLRAVAAAQTEDRYAAVHARIRDAARHAQRDPSLIRLLAVSKGQPAVAIEHLRRAGQREFGESYLKEALEKMDTLADPTLIWHFIGPLQANKCRDIAQRFHWLHSLDRSALADRLNRLRPSHLPPLEVCLQVKLSEEPRKAGIPPHELPLLAAHVARLPRLRLRGLMTIPRASDEIAEQRATYRHLRELSDALRREGHPLDTLSMGMSGDLEAAIFEGSTIVRIGSALFGPRATTPAASPPSCTPPDRC